MSSVMHKLAVIGSRGLIGKQITESFLPTATFNSDNINQLPINSYDTIICAAPSGNRRVAEQDPIADRNNIQTIIDALNRTKFNRLVLIGSVDSLLYPSSAYGANRLHLENFVLSCPSKSHVIRLCTLISPFIKKNMLYDLKHWQFVDQINQQSRLQWYNLSNLHQDIQQSIDQNIKSITLVSEPIINKEIIEKFFYERQAEIGINPGPELKYNITPYQTTREEILVAMEHYLK